MAAAQVKPPHTMEEVCRTINYLSESEAKLKQVTGRERVKLMAEMKAWVKHIGLPLLEEELKFYQDNPSARAGFEYMIPMLEQQVNSLKSICMM
jgi:hypothetical protein